MLGGGCSGTEIQHGQVLKLIWYFFLAVPTARGLFLVVEFLAQQRAKTSRGAGGVLLSTRPPAVEYGRAPMEGGLGGGRDVKVIHNGFWGAVGLV